MPIPLLSVMHVNVNCSDLERSLGFYRNQLGLTALSHTNPVPQAGEGFGFEGRVQWDAHLLHDARGFAGPAVDLLEWKQPLPTGRPHANANEVGMFRLCFTHPDLDTLYQSLQANGVTCRSEPTGVPISPEIDLAVRFFCASDPDGTTVEFIEMPGPLRLLHINVNCRDLARSSAWYQNVLGLEHVGHSSPGAVPGGAFGFSGDAEWSADFLAVPGRADHFIVDLLEWKTPRPTGAPYAEANHLGLYRLAFLVEDAHACRDQLVADGVACDPPVWLDMGPELPIDGLWAVFFRDPDSAARDQRELAESSVLTLAVHAGVQARLAHHLADDRAQDGRIFDGRDRRSANPALCDCEHAAGRLEDTASYIARICTRQPRDDRCNPARALRLAHFVGDLAGL